MTVTISGTTGITSVNGTAGAPSMTGADTDTGIVYGTNTMSLATGGTTAVTVDSSQNVGIGTSSPLQQLHLSSASATGMQITYQGVGAARIGVASGNALTFGLDTSNGSTERMRIDSSGKLLVNTASAIASSSAILQAKGTTNNPVGAFDCQQTSGIFYFYYQGSLVGNISTNGSNLTLNSTSDYRRKDGIQPLTGALEKVNALRPVSYTWKDSGLEGQGFIAHELQEVVPECVTGEKDAVDADGNPVYQGIDTSFLVATLTAAIQEQQAIIEQLQADVAALKAK